MAGDRHMGLRNEQTRTTGKPPVLSSLQASCPTRLSKDWTVIDLCSGCGGMSCGFARRAGFQLIAAVDAEHGKPSRGRGRLDCNATYAANIGIQPFRSNLGTKKPAELFTTIANP